MTAARVDQWLPALHRGDAIGDSAFHIRDHLRCRGFQSNLYALTVDRGVDGLPMDAFDGSADAVILHFALPSPLSERLRHFPGRRAIIYHNITPAHYFEPYSHKLARMCTAGRMEITTLVEFVDLALADSEYNRLELDVMGFRRTGEFPIFMDLSRYEAGSCGALRRHLRDGRRNILFVGRVVPNKRIEHLIKAAFYYRKFISPRVRLIVVGKDTLLPAYSRSLRKLAGDLMLSSEDVVFTGHVTHEELVTCYRNSHCFLSLSEHEGFCVPLIESMVFDVPIVALARGAVPFTLGGAGLLLESPDAAEVAEAVSDVCENEELREGILEAQRERLEYFRTERLERLLDEYVDELLGSGGRAPAARC
ncbi:MAG: glycosyltransferase [Acidobacteriota bacterium]